MNSQILESTLAALRRSGSVFGVILNEGSATVYSDLAYLPDRVADLTTILDDICFYFEQEGRDPDALAFSYDGGNLILLRRDGLRLVVLHHNADEADFIAVAGNAFLKDLSTSRSVKAFVKEERGVPTGPTPAVAPKKKLVDPTAPISPVGV